MRKRSRSAFTLLELLAVMAVLALLISLLLPGLRAARMLAGRLSCASNLHQIGTAVILYAQANRGRFPETTHGQTADKSWIYTLAGFLQEVDAVRICPADAKRTERLREQLSSYILNEYVAVDHADPFGRPLKSYTNLYQLKLASKTMTAFEISDQAAVSITSDHTHSRQWFSVQDGRAWDRICRDIQPDRHRTGFSVPDQTRGSANYLFADAHVETISAAQLHQKAQAGVDFAKPPE